MTKLQIKVGDHVLTKTQIEAESYNNQTSSKTEIQCLPNPK
jgi:hypothetical protein